MQMRAAEAQALGRLAGIAVGAATRRIGEVHAAIAQRAFGRVRGGVGPAVTPVHVVHDGIAGAVYATVRSALDAGCRAAGLAAAGFARDDGALADHPSGRYIMAVLNGVHGDMLHRELVELALPMSLRHEGRDLAVEAGALAAAYPDATARLAVFLQGLVQTEDAWRSKALQHYGDRSVTYGTLLRRDLGYTPVWLRYNTGLHVSANGRRLAGLLGRLVDAWPVPVEDMAIIGHSMGGLVARIALARRPAAGRGENPGLAGEGVEERVDGGVVLGHAPDLGRLAVPDVEDVHVLPLGARAVLRGCGRGPEHDHVVVVAEDVVDLGLGRGADGPGLAGEEVQDVDLALV
jgi:pimeloyl-ACP methyl ester carboxylesterase